jgi:hypothetical protein
VSPKTKTKLEVLWQDFEKSGSIEAYLSYHQSKLSKAKAKAKEPKKSVAKAGKSSR